VLDNNIIIHRTALYKVFLDDSFEDVGRTTMIPGSFGVDHGDGAVSTYTETVGFRAEYATRVGEVEFVQAFFQVFPRLQTPGFFHTIRFGLITAEE